MSQLLELPHLVNENRMTDVQIGRSRVETRFHDQRPPLLEFFLEPVLGQNLVRTPTQLRYLFLDVAHFLPVLKRGHRRRS